MAITVHQTKWAGRSADVSSKAVTFDATPTAGSAVIVGVWNYAPSDANLIVDVTDNKSNVYTKAISHFASPASDMAEAGVYHCLNIASSATFTVTVNCSGGNTNYPNIAVMEVSGLLTSAAVDQTGVEDTSATTTTAVATDGTTAQAEELAVAAISCFTGLTGSVDATSYTNFGEEEDGSTWMVGATSYCILSAIGVQTASYTHPLTSGNGAAACIATYKAAVTGSKTLTLLGAG